MGGWTIPDGGTRGVINISNKDVAPRDAVIYGFKASPWVYACVDRTATAASSIPWRVEHKTGSGERDWEPDPNDWRAKLLNYPNPYMSSKELFYWAYAWGALNGNMLLRATPGGAGFVELLPMSPVSVEPVPDKMTWIRGYNIIEDGKVKYAFGREEIIHARLPDPLNPLWGQGRLQAAWASVKADTSSANYRKTLYESGGVPPGAITDNALTTTEALEAAHNQLKLAWRKNSTENVPMILGSGAHYLPFGFSASDLQIPEDRQLTVNEIVTAFGFLPAMFDSSAATYENLRTSVRFMYDNAVMPLCDLMRDALNLFLLTEEERQSDTVWITYDLSAVPFFRQDRQEKIKQLGEGIRNGISRNDMVSILELGVEDAEGGDEVFIESGLTLLSEAAEGAASVADSKFQSVPGQQPMPADMMDKPEEPVVPAKPEPDAPEED
jgi:HK97 family phage portal protein